MTYDYDVLVIGGGAAGLTSAGIATNLGAKTLMIERDRLGGDCTWTGCVPSKALLKSAKVAHQMRTANHYGLKATEPKIDFGAVMQRVRDLRREIYEEADAPEVFEAMDIDVRFGEAHFVDPHTVSIEGSYVTGRFIVVCTGGRPLVPPIPGLDDAPYLTNDSLFELTEQPDRLAIVGAGPIGTEMAQAFQRLGTDVTVVEMGDRILSNDDPELTGMLLDVLQGEGVTYHFETRAAGVVRPNGALRLLLDRDGEEATLSTDALLLATGRRPHVEALHLEAAGVDYTPKGLTVDDRCRTNVSHIFGVGDVTGRYQFTHMSEHMAKVAVTNALLKVPMSMDTGRVPWVTYSDPELAHVGATEAQLAEAGTSYQTYRFPYRKVDRAITDGATTGLIKVHARSLDGKIYGASVLGARAGELISQYALALRNGVTLRAIADTIYPYPSYGQAARRAADQWYAQKQSPLFTRFLKTVFGYRGPVIEPEEGRIV